MLTDSPWAKQQRVVLGTLSEAPELAPAPPTIPGASRSGPRSARVVLAGGGQFDRIRRAEVTVTWVTALPIRQAHVRQAIGRNAPVPPDAQATLLQEAPLYVVTVAGLPSDFGELARMGDTVKAATMVKRENSEPMVPENVQFFEDSRDQTITAAFSFPKTDAMTRDDKEIELVTDLGGSPLKKKFKLADMVFHGQLEL